MRASIKITEKVSNFSRYMSYPERGVEEICADRKGKARVWASLEGAHPAERIVSKRSLLLCCDALTGSGAARSVAHVPIFSRVGPRTNERWHAATVPVGTTQVRRF
jgi:hypothetical protein